MSIFVAIYVVRIHVFDQANFCQTVFELFVARCIKSKMGNFFIFLDVPQSEIRFCKISLVSTDF